MCFSFCMLLFLTIMRCLFLEVLKSSKGAEGLLEPNHAGQSKQGTTCWSWAGASRPRGDGQSVTTSPVKPLLSPAGWRGQTPLFYLTVAPVELQSPSASCAEAVRCPANAAVNAAV